MINELIDELISYGICNGLVEPVDEVYMVNRLLELFKLNEYQKPLKKGNIRPLHEILEDIVAYAIKEGILEEDTITAKDLFDTKIMGILTPLPSYVQKTFNELYEVSPNKATDYYYKLSQATNYIRKDRVEKDEKWVTETEYGLSLTSARFAKLIPFLLPIWQAISDSLYLMLKYRKTEHRGKKHLTAEQAAEQKTLKLSALTKQTPDM